MENNTKREPRQTAVSAGNRLKEAREKKPLTIEQVQKITRIHSTVLIALEEGRAGDLLTDTYVRSFLKKYAQFLGLNPAELVKEYFPASVKDPSANIPLRENTLPRETKIKPKFLYFVGIVMLAAIFILLLVFVTGKAVSSLKAFKAARQKSALISKKNPAQTAKNTPKKRNAAKSQSEQKELIPKSASLNLTISVKEPVLVQLKKDGVLIFERVLTKGLVETIVANNSIELGIGKAGALDLSLNGRPIVLPIKKIRFGLEITRKGVKVK